MMLAEDLKKTMGKKIKQERLKRSWTVEELAERADISSSFLSSVERGARSLSLENLLKFSDIFETTVDFLLNDYPFEKGRSHILNQLTQNFKDEEFTMVVEIVRPIKKFFESLRPKN
jgi:transcriptional regulator with XRE-family HTH domain